jgi:hypothetical protein
VNQIHGMNKNDFKSIFTTVGALSCNVKTFYVPIIAGIVIGPLQESFSDLSRILPDLIDTKKN